MTEVPAGYITMEAGAIRTAVTKAIADYDAKYKIWIEDLPGKLVAWRNGGGFWHKVWYLFETRDPKKLVKWYTNLYGWDRPDVPDLLPRPIIGMVPYDWLRRVKHMADDTTVLICVDDAAYVKSWLA